MGKRQSGIIYILTNPSFPDWIKIGHCSDLNTRISALSSNTCLPFPFQCFYACNVKDPKKVEVTLHFIFNQFRLSPKREFFDIDPEKVIAVLSLLPDIEELPSPISTSKSEEKILIDKEIAKQSQFKFTHASIPLGEKIYLTRKPAVTAIVVNDVQVELNGAVLNLTEATEQCMNDHLGGSKTQISSPRYWSYDGEMLIKRKRRLAK